MVAAVVAVVAVAAEEVEAEGEEAPSHPAHKFCHQALSDNQEGTQPLQAAQVAVELPQPPAVVPLLPALH